MALKGIGVDNEGAVESDEILTFEHTALVAANEGKLVKISASNTVALCADGDPFIGQILKVEKNKTCSVKLDGIVTIPYTGADPALGFSPLIADAAGGVKVGIGTGPDQIRRVINVDVANKIVTFLF